MGDKSPKSRDKNKKQDIKRKASDRASARKKQENQASSTTPGASKPGQ